MRSQKLKNNLFWPRNILILLKLKNSKSRICEGIRFDFNSTGNRIEEAESPLVLYARTKAWFGNWRYYHW